ARPATPAVVRRLHGLGRWPCHTGGTAGGFRRLRRGPGRGLSRHSQNGRPGPLPALSRGPGALLAVRRHASVHRRQHAAFRLVVPAAPRRRLPRLAPGREPAHRLRATNGLRPGTIPGVRRRLIRRRAPGFVVVITVRTVYTSPFTV